MKLRGFLLIFAVVCIVFLSPYLYAYIVFSGVFDTKYSHEEAVELFATKEKEYADAIHYFQSVCPKNTQISFNIDDFGVIALRVVPDGSIYTNTSNYLHYIEPDEDKSYPVLNELHWTIETVKTIKYKLEKTKCISIATSEIQQHPIVMYPYQSGHGSFSYLIFTDTLPGYRYGRPIGTSLLGSRVFIHWSNAL